MEKITSREMLIREVADVMQLRFDECRPLINLTTQEVGAWLNPMLYGEDCKWPNEGDKVIEIEMPSSHEAFEVMKEFANSQSDSIARKLWLALEGKHPFARFKDTVNFLGIQELWYAFQNKWYEEIVENWLRVEGVEVKDGRIVTSGDYITWSED